MPSRYSAKTLHRVAASHRHNEAIAEAEGRQAPCGRKPKGFVANPIFKKPLARLTKVQQMQVLDRKVRKADYKRLIYPAKKTSFLAEQARIQDERNAAAERERLAQTAAAQPGRPAVVDSFRAMERERIRLLESGPMPRKHGVLDDPRYRERLTAQDFTAGIKRY